MRKIFQSIRFLLAPQRFFWVLLAFGLLSGCKSQPAPIEEAPPIVEALSLPSFALTLKDIVADDPSYVKAYFLLEAETMLSTDSHANIVSWHVDIDGQDPGSALYLDYRKGDFYPGDPIQLRLDIDLDALAAKGLAPKDEYNITLIAELDFFVPSAEAPIRREVRGNVSFPGVRPPVFSINDIAILQAELINTRFRVGLKIDNPNQFPIELSAFSYKLYGNGRFWADGSERNVLKVNGSSSLSGNIFLIMNFIDMDRNLLDQIIRLDDVNYRFQGDVDISTGVAYLPKFHDSFNLTGYSKVFTQ